MSLRIEKLVGIASLQGLPITGCRRFGVPMGGAFDQLSFALANALLRNPPDTWVIEFSNAAAELVFGVPTRVAVVGAGAPNAAFDVGVGERVSIEAPRVGLRSYLAVAGGIVPDGIDSALARSGRLLAAGDVLQCAERQPVGREIRLAAPDSIAGGPIRVLPGRSRPAGRVQVSVHSDRTGIRLDGLEPQPMEESASEPVCVGAIQLTPSGQLLVIGPDGPTIGGYPQVGYVCSADLDRLAHLRPGQDVEFEDVTMDEARVLARERRRHVESLAKSVAIALQ